jgi:hypothetical protein
MGSLDTGAFLASPALPWGLCLIPALPLFPACRLPGLCLCDFPVGLDLTSTARLGLDQFAQPSSGNRVGPG